MDAFLIKRDAGNLSSCRSHAAPTPSALAALSDTARGLHFEALGALPSERTPFSYPKMTLVPYPGSLPSPSYSPLHGHSATNASNRRVVQSSPVLSLIKSWQRPSAASPPAPSWRAPSTYPRAAWAPPGPPACSSASILEKRVVRRQRAVT